MEKGDEAREWQEEKRRKGKGMNGERRDIRNEL